MKLNEAKTILTPFCANLQSERNISLVKKLCYISDVLFQKTSLNIAERLSGFN
jgi:hypothetical protein